MTLNAFTGRPLPPGDEDLASVLGDTFALWSELRSDIERDHSPVSAEWVRSGKNSGWMLRLKREKRAILYMSPCEGFFLASFALGEKAVKAARSSSMPSSVLNVIDNARKYAEGRAVRFEVRSIDDVRNVEKVAVVKMAN